MSVVIVGFTAVPVRTSVLLTFMGVNHGEGTGNEYPQNLEW